MAWGFFKKCVIADRIAPMVAPVFVNPEGYHGMTLLVAAALFTFQIYCDFSGYSDIALGSAEVMGFKLMENFRQPFGAKTVQEFWTRWHISLSSWFNDYVFTPLVYRYREHGRAAVVGATLVTFGLAGLWHGAGWNFVVFGLLHGVAVAFDALTKKPRRQLERQLPGWLYGGASVLTTFAYVAFAFIFFRAPTLAEGWAYVQRLGLGLGEQLSSLHALWASLAPLDPDGAQLLILCLALVALEAVQAAQHRPLVLERFESQPRWVRWPAYQALFWTIVLLGVYQNQAFIYFQF